MSKTEKLKIYEIHKMSILPNLENDDKSKTVLELLTNCVMVVNKLCYDY